MNRYCDICNKPQKNLTKHLIMAHGLNKAQAYEMMMVKYPDFFANCIVCETKISKPASAGGKTTCSEECSKEARRRVNLGRKQEAHVIEARIKNTDQRKKQAAREKTMLERYGSLYAPNDPEARREKLRKKRGKRPEFHQRKIIETKRKNGTLKHSEHTKNKIRNSVNLLYASDNPPCTISSGSPKGYKTGCINDIPYRSSYEKIFLEYCQLHKILVESASNTRFRLQYHDEDGKQHFYYPDFYLPCYDCVIEIKPVKMLNEGLNPLKIKAGNANYNFKIVTEYELNDLSAFFNQLTESK
jgi:predicted nucleic acid-binding Zn ribbon protein